MIELYVSGQKLTLTTPVVAADSLRYLRARAYFTEPGWEGLSRWVHFKRGGTVYDLELDAHDEITEEDALNLTAGEWTVYVTGFDEQTRITTTPVTLTVKESGLVDAPLHQIPLSALEQLSYRVELALRLVRSLRRRATIDVLGFFGSLSALSNTVRRPRPGEAYAVGAQAPYRVYMWDGIGQTWVDAGSIVTAPAEGPRGVTFIPRLDEAGNLVWTNDGELENPAPVNITGPAGAAGEPGPAGESAYESAAEHGYVGDAEAFYAALAALPEHAQRHLPTGADPILIRTGNLENGAVTTQKLAADAVSAVYTLDVGTAWTGNAAPYTQEIAVAGLSENDRLLADAVTGDGYNAQTQDRLDAWARVYRIASENNKVVLYASERPDTAFQIRILAVKR